jgi:membrane-bound lytic murein transglycosylase D
MKVNKLVIGAFALVGFLVILFLAQSFLSSSAVEGSLPNSYEELTDSSYRDFVKDNYSVYAIEIPNNASFANEVVPVTNTDVKERLERELHVNTYWHSQTFLFHKRAGRWFPIIEPILKENGVPDDFKYLCVIESGLDNVVSPAGASGFWQFMKKTGLGYNLEITADVDERYNLEKATQAACKYLKEAHEKFGNWTSAAASYNMGKGGLNKRLTNQKVSSYYDLHLNNETSRYLMRIIAAKYILSEPQYFGFRLRAEDIYRPYETKEIEVDSTVINLVDFAHKNKISYRTLKVLNPWLRSSKLTITEGTSYQIKIPTSGFEFSGKIKETNE